MREDSKRIASFDIAKGIGILLVMWGHARLVTDEPVFFYTAGMKLPVFFLVSGVLMLRKYQSITACVSGYVLKRLKQMMIPYFFYSILSVLIFIVQTYSKDSVRTIAQVKSESFDMITLRGISTLWFLPVMLVSEIMVVLMHVIIKNIRTETLISLIAAVVVCSAGNNSSLVTEGTPFQINLFLLVF